jgi:hypothetical protein
MIRRENRRRGPESAKFPVNFPVSDCNESLRLNPGSANALDSRGFAHLKLGDLDHSDALMYSAVNVQFLERHSAEDFAAGLAYAIDREWLSRKKRRRESLWPGK